jgi:hypothetical protein
MAREHSVTILPAVPSSKPYAASLAAQRGAQPMIGSGNPLLDGPDVSS